MLTGAGKFRQKHFSEKVSAHPGCNGAKKSSQIADLEG